MKSLMTLPTLDETEVCGPVEEKCPAFVDDSKPRVLGASGGSGPRVCVHKGRVQWHAGAVDVHPVVHLGKDKWGLKLYELLRDVHNWQ